MAGRDKVLLPLAVLAEVQKEKAEKEQAEAVAIAELLELKAMIRQKIESTQAAGV